MAKKIADLLIKIGADSYEFTKMSAEVRKQLNALGKDLQGFGKSMSLYFTAPLTAAAGASVHLADVQMQAEKRLLTALKGREDVQKRLIKQAGELQSRSILGDEVIIGQQAFLASLGLTEQQINDTIEASAQLAAATGMTLDSAVKNLAKTYGGLTGELGESIPALKQFTAEELKNGAAVKFALENYKGFAEAIAETGLGPMQQLKNSLGDLGEQIGVILMPMVQQIVGWLQDFVAWLQQLSPATKTTIVAIGGLVAAIGPLSLGLGTVLKMLPLLKAGFAAMLGPVGLVATAIAAVTTAIIGFNAAKKQAFSDAADQLVEKWRDGNYTPEQLSDLQSRKQARVFALKTGIYYDQKSNDYDPKKPERIRQSKEEIAQLEIEIEAIRRLIEIRKQAASAAESIITTTTEENSGTKKATGLIGELQEKISKLEEAKKSTFNTYEIHNLNLELEKLRAKLEELQNTGKSGSIIGNTSGLLQGKITPLQFDPNAINPPAEIWDDAKGSFLENLNAYGRGIKDDFIDFGNMLNSLVRDMAISFGEGLGNILSGDGTFDDLLASFGKSVGQFLVSLGKQLIMTSEIIQTIKEALSSIWATPWIGVIVGAAAIAAGTALINAFSRNAGKGVALANGGLAYGPTMALVGDNRGAGSDPEVIAPLSKLRQYGLGRQSIEFIGGQFRLSGSDLLLSIRREDAKVSYINAGV